MGKTISSIGMFLDAIPLYSNTLMSNTALLQKHSIATGQTHHLFMAVCSGNSALKVELKDGGSFACISHFKKLLLGAMMFPGRLPSSWRGSHFFGCGGGDCLCFLAVICLSRHQSSANWKPLQVKQPFIPDCRF
jgi:hypothetical protein